MARGRSGNLGLLLILLVVLAGAGGWNYHRNYQAEIAERSASRFSGYDTEGLEQLAAAYRSELDVYRSQYRTLEGGRVSVRNTTGVGEGIEQFERVRRSGDRLRAVKTELATREARVAEIEQELATRRSAASGLRLHLERLTGASLPI